MRPSRDVQQRGPAGRSSREFQRRSSDVASFLKRCGGAAARRRSERKEEESTGEKKKKR